MLQPRLSVEWLNAYTKLQVILFYSKFAISGFASRCILMLVEHRLISAMELGRPATGPDMPHQSAALLVEQRLLASLEIPGSSLQLFCALAFPQCRGHCKIIT